MSIRAKLIGGCDAMLLASMGAFQIGMLIAIASVAPLQAAPSQAAPVRHDSIALDTAHVEVVVVEAAKISRG